MPVFSSGIKDRIELINYYLKDRKDKQTALSILYVTLETAVKNGISKVKVSVDHRDKELVKAFEKYGFKYLSNRVSYIK